VHLTIHNLLVSRSRSIGATAIVLALAVAAPASAQIRRIGPSVSDTNPLMGGVPTGTATAQPESSTLPRRAGASEDADGG